MVAFLEKEMEIVVIRPSIMRDIDTLVNFAQGHGEDRENDAAARVETYLRDVRAAEAKEEPEVSADFSK